MKLLLAEDDESDATLFVRSARQQLPDVEILVLHDGEEVLENLREQPLPDLVILDGRLPKLSGLEILRELRSDPTLRDLKVIGASGAISPRDEKDWRSLGVIDLIFKDFDQQRYLDAIMRAVRNALG